MNTPPPYYDNNNVTTQYAGGQSVASVAMKRVYVKMTLALLVTAFVS